MSAAHMDWGRVSAMEEWLSRIIVREAAAWEARAAAGGEQRLRRQIAAAERGVRSVQECPWFTGDQEQPQRKAA